MDSIAKTSLLTAAMRAKETQRSESDGRLFSDPYAEILSGDEGFNLLEEAIAASGEQPAIAIRTAYMDRQISTAVKDGIQQIVMLASGMDTRSYRLSFPSSLRVFELDRQEVFNYKQDKLKNIKPTCEHHFLSVDLREDWTSTLLKSGFQQNASTLWLIEGLLMYLQESQVMSLLKKINSLAQGKDILLCDILSQSLLEAPHMRNQLEFLKKIGAPWYFGTNDPVDFFNRQGWKATLSQPGDFAPTRWPFPTAPLHIPNIPRGYYVEAIKND